MKEQKVFGRTVKEQIKIHLRKDVEKESQKK